jgi:hypothetical protein
MTGSVMVRGRVAVRLVIPEAHVVLVDVQDAACRDLTDPP